MTAPRLKEKYTNEIVAKLEKDLALDNVNKVPRLEKIVVNMGVGAAAADHKLLDAAMGDLRIITVSTSTSYMGQIRLHDRVRVTTTCEKIGNKSLTLFQQLVVDGQVRSESRSVMVAFDFSRQQSMPVPDAWRERLLAD